MEPIPEPTEGLLDRVRRGDDAAFEALYRLYARPAFTVAARMLADRDAAEDVLQDAFIELTRALPGYRGDGPFWAWFRKIVVTRVLMRLRAERSRPTLVAWEPDHEPADERSGPPLLARDLEQALAALPPLTRAIVWLVDVEGWTHVEVADAMGRSTSFSKSQLSRGHRRLRALLEEDDGRYPEQAARVAAARPA